MACHAIRTAKNCQEVGVVRLSPTAMPAINSRLAGPPFERHAACVVAEMAKWLAGERAELMAALDRSKAAHLGYH
jgi:hypothetical protein